MDDGHDSLENAAPWFCLEVRFIMYPYMKKTLNLMDDLENKLKKFLGFLLKKHKKELPWAHLGGFEAIGLFRLDPGGRLFQTVKKSDGPLDKEAWEAADLQWLGENDHFSGTFSMTRW